MKRNFADPDHIERRLDALKDVPERSSTSAAQGRAKFLEQARVMRASLNEPAPVPEAAPFLSKLFKTLRPAQWVTAAIVAVGLFMAGSSVAVAASQVSLPGDEIYPLKVWSENSLYALMPTQEARLHLTLTLTDRRMQEITQLKSIGRPIPAEVVDRFQAELDQSLALAAGMPDAEVVESLKSVTARAEAQLQTLNTLLAGTANPPGLVVAQTRLETQIDEGNSGQSNPAGFKLEFQGTTGKPENTHTKTQTTTFTATSTPTFTPTLTTTLTPSVTDTPDYTLTRTRKPTHTPRTKVPPPKGNPDSSQGANNP